MGCGWVRRNFGGLLALNDRRSRRGYKSELILWHRYVYSYSVKGVVNPVCLFVKNGQTAYQIRPARYLRVETVIVARLLAWYQSQDVPVLILPHKLTFELLGYIENQAPQLGICLLV